MKDDMTTDNHTDKLEDAIDAIKSDAPSATDIDTAVTRVKEALAPHRGPQAIVAEDGELTPAAAERWDSIEDYIAAIPAYLAGELSPAQTTLFEEEARSSIPLRRALNEARGRAVSEQIAERKTSRTGLYALAATVAAMAVAVVIALPQLPSFNQSQLAQVDTVDGQLYQIVEGRLETLTPGTWLDGRQRIRSAPGSKAFITLDDGSEIEIDGRSEISLVRRSAGNRIDVSRGRILVHAAPQASGTLDVFTNEMEVSVVGTIFEVAHGAKGSRVAVVEGSVDVLMQGARTSLEPGEVMGSRAELNNQYLALNVADEISWSGNADEYIAMLQEVQALQQDLQAIMASQPRYSTRLLDLAPEDTALYFAVPNAPEKISEVYQVVKNRAQSSQFLAEQWAEFEAQEGAQYLDEVMAWIGEIGHTLGEETVFAVTMGPNGAEDEAVPVVLSEVDASNFAATFELMAQRLEEVLIAEGHDADATDFELKLINDPSEAAEGELSVMLIDDIMVATIDADTMAEMAAIVANGGSAFTSSELHELLSYSYVMGTQILGAVDIERMMSALTVEADDAAELEEIGLDNIKYLIGQGVQQDGWSTITADLYFDGPRTGVMSWIAEPAPMGSLEFFSADTTLVGAMLIREPISIMDDLGPFEFDDDFDAQAELDLFLSVMGVLGGEFALGLDGPALPTPAWKAVVEAYDGDVIQEAIEWSINRANEEFVAEGIDSTVDIVNADVGSYSGYRVSLSFDPDAIDTGDVDFDISFGSISFHYAYVDGYLVAGPNEAMVDRAIDFYQSGSGLPTSTEFRDLLARDGYLDFSAVYFSRLGELISDALGALPANLTAEQQATIDAMNPEIGPSMVSVLALEDRIHFAHSGSTEFPTQVFAQLIAFAPMLEDLEEEYQIID